MDAEETRVDATVAPPRTRIPTSVESTPGALPRRFGAYQLEQEIARGGQGVVYRATHCALNTRVALKVLLRPEDSSTRRLHHEARVLARLRHPDLLGVSDLGEVGGYPFLAMDLVEGSDLQSLVASEGVPPFAMTVEVLERIARTLQYCHEQGVIHRDLKPANVIVEEGTGRPVLVDFGLVKRDPAKLDMPSLDGLSLTGELKGTPAYMAPEQVDPELYGEAGPPADVYALGATLYHLLTGVPPYDGHTAYNVIVKIMRGDPPDPSIANPDAPPGLARLCRQAMASDPARRPPSCAAFADALRAGVDSPSPASPGGSSPRPVAVAAALCLGVGLGVLWSPRAGDPRSDPIEAVEPNQVAAEQEAPAPRPKVGRKARPKTDPGLPATALSRILLDRKAWQRASEAAQDAAIRDVALRLGGAFERMGTRVYRRNGQQHRIATFRHARTGVELNLIPGGRYRMGGEASRPEHWVLVQPILLGRFELRQREWSKLSKQISCHWYGEDLPVESTPLPRLRAWLKAAGDGLRLPSEAEWEYACRAGTMTRYFWGTTPDHALFWHRKNSGKQTHEVTEHVDAFNAFGLVDMAGNISERCQDDYLDTYDDGPNDHRPRRSPSAKMTVVRGGSWAHDLAYATSHMRAGTGPEGNNAQGYRLARSLLPD